MAEWSALRTTIRGVSGSTLPMHIFERIEHYNIQF